jgi:hypothetical protein
VEGGIMINFTEKYREMIQEQEEKKDVNVGSVIKELIDTSWSGSNDEQGKAVQLLRGLAFSDDPKSNKFMKALDKFTSGLKAEDFS